MYTHYLSNLAGMIFQAVAVMKKIIQLS